MDRIGGWKKFLLVAGIDLFAFAAALYVGAPLLYAGIGLGVVAFMEFVIATM